MMPALRIPLVGSITNRGPSIATQDSEQIFVNAFPEVLANNFTGNKKFILTKRPGFSASAATSTNNTGQPGSVVWSSAASGANPGLPVFSFRTSATTTVQFFFGDGSGQIGAEVSTVGTASCIYMAETDINGTGNLTAMISDASTMKAYFFPNGGSWTNVIDGDFPSNARPPHAHLDGFWFVMTEDAKIYHSDLNTLSSWNPVNFITAGSFGDHGIGCARFKNYIVGFGDSSIEFFYNAGNATGSVLNAIPDATIRLGAARTSVSTVPSMRELVGSIYFIGVDTAGNKGIYRIKGLGAAEKISTTEIDKWVAVGQITAVLGSFTMFGVTHVAFLASATGLGQLCYCVDTGFWWWFRLGAGTFNATAFLGSSTVSSFSQAYMISGSLPRIFSVSSNITSFQDATTSYAMSVTTRAMDMDTRKKKVWETISVIADKQASSSLINIAAADEDNTAFTDYSNSVDLSSATLNKLTRLGASRKRAWAITHSTNTACRIEALEIEYRVGNS